VAPDRALVIGGTGPTGPAVVEGLAERGYQVTILHAGLHEVEFAVPGIRHIHEDPHFQETIERGIGRDQFDLVVAQYGRLRVIADVFAGRTGRLIAIGGATGIFAGPEDSRWGEIGRPALFPEDVGIYETTAGPDGSRKIGLRMVQAMDNLFSRHAAGDYSATYVMYPVNYGARNPGPYDWSIVRRILDGRSQYIIADGGLKLESRVYSENAAQAVLLTVDSPDIAAGKRYSVADLFTYTMRQRIEFIAAHLGHELRLVDMPYDLAWPCHPYWRRTREHRLCTSNLIRAELGYAEATPPDEGMSRTIDWLVANRPSAGGEAEQQIGDPFDYESEDAIIGAWEHSGATSVAVESRLPSAGHQYRHPKAPGEAWKPKPDSAATTHRS
jgi:nucleoside-diphosphate-sugar epimerase